MFEFLSTLRFKKEEKNKTNIKCFVINLKRRDDRFIQFHKNLSSVGIGNIQRYLAVDTSDVQVLKNAYPLLTEQAWKEANSPFRTNHAQLSIGAIGCYLSHVNLWKQLVNENNETEYYLIFEDDIRALKNLKLDLKTFLERFPVRDFDIIALGNLVYTPYGEKQNKIQNLYETSVAKDKDDNDKKKSYIRVARFFGLHAYIISKEGAKKFLSRCFPIQMQIDSYISNIIVPLDIKAYVTIPSVFYQDRTFGTDIQIPCIGCGNLK